MLILLRIRQQRFRKSRSHGIVVEGRLVLVELPDDLGRVSCGEDAGGDVLVDDAAGSNRGAFADRDTRPRKDLRLAMWFLLVRGFASASPSESLDASQACSQDHSIDTNPNTILDDHLGTTARRLLGAVLETLLEPHGVVYRDDGYVAGDAAPLADDDVCYGGVEDLEIAVDERGGADLQAQAVVDVDGTLDVRRRRLDLVRVWVLE